MTWKCWIVLLVIAAAATGIVVWQNREVARLEALQAHLMQERSEAMNKALLARQDVRRNVAAMEALTAERDDLKALLEAAGEAVVLQPTPRTLDDYRVRSNVLGRRIKLLELDLSLCDKQVGACKAALAASELESEQYRKVIDIDTDRFKLLYKQQRKEKRNKILIGVGAALAAGLVGYGIGVSVR